MNGADTLTLTLAVDRANHQNDVRYRLAFADEVKEGAVQAGAAKASVVEGLMHIIMSLFADELTTELMGAFPELAEEAGELEPIPVGALEALFGSPLPRF